MVKMIVGNSRSSDELQTQHVSEKDVSDGQHDSSLLRYVFISIGISLLLLTSFLIRPNAAQRGLATNVANAVSQNSNINRSVPVPVSHLPLSEKKACEEPLPNAQCPTSEDEEEPPVEEVAPGKRVRMPSFEGMEYQLFLPSIWKPSHEQVFPVVVFLHGAGDGKFSVMNSQSLPRLLRKNQSTCFDSRACWCLDQEYSNVVAMREAPDDGNAAFMDEEEELRSPLADCDFADTFGAIVVMPQGFLPGSFTGWSQTKLSTVKSLVRSVIHKYGGDPDRVVLTGQSAGGGGAWSFAASQPRLWSAVNIVCMPAPPSIASRLEGLPIWVVGFTGDGLYGNDDVVVALKHRKTGHVRYTRYIKAPAPPDPLYRSMHNHASYDLIYRDPRLWQWALSQRNTAGTSEWAQA